MDLRRTNAIIFSIISTMINIFLENIIGSFNIAALQFNTLGTIFTSVVYGPWYGSMTGLLTGIIRGVSKDVRILPFALSSIAIGIIVGFITRKKRFTYYNSLVIGLIIGASSGIILTLTNPFVYVNLVSMISNNIVDKVASSLVVVTIGNLLGKRFFKEIK